MENIDKEDFFKKAHTALIELYASGYKLEEIDLEFENEDVNLKKNLSFENKNVKQIANLEFDTKYWKVFNPINKNIHEPN